MRSWTLVIVFSCPGSTAMDDVHSAGRRGLPAGNFKLHSPTNCFAIFLSPLSSLNAQLSGPDLTVSICQYSSSTGSGAAEDVNHDRHPTAGLVDGFHFALEFSKVPSLIFTRSPVVKPIFNFGAFALFFLLGHDAGDFVGEHWRGPDFLRGHGPGGAPVKSPIPGVSRTKYHVSSLISILTTNSRIKLALDYPLLAALELRHFFRGDDHVAEISPQAGDRHAAAAGPRESIPRGCSAP